MKNTFARASLAAIALCAVSVVLADAANSTKRTTFVAGGATLPAVGYSGPFGNTNLKTVPSTTSVFGYFKSTFSPGHENVQYCQTGSGFGKKVFNGTDNVNQPCPAFNVKPADGVNGFSAPSALGLTDPDVAGSDSPLSQGEYSTFIANRGALRSEPVELPEIVGAVAMLYNNPDLGGHAQINLTDSQICNLVAGHISNWNQLGSFPSRPLKFVFRSDGSGTTFSFSNHLSAVCSTTLGFSTSQQFANTVTPTPNPPVFVRPSGSVPSNFVGASGNGGVTSTITSTTGSIGYVEAANALGARNVATGMNFAKVNGFDPIRNLPETAAKLSTASIVKDRVVSVSSGHAASTALIAPAPPHPNCVLLLTPSGYANITGGYPIIAVSYQLYGYKSNGLNNSDLRRLATLLFNNVGYNNSSTKKITTVDAASTTLGTGTTGYSTLSFSFLSTINLAANTCINT